MNARGATVLRTASFLEELARGTHCTAAGDRAEAGGAVPCRFPSHGELRCSRCGAPPPAEAGSTEGAEVEPEGAPVSAPRGRKWSAYQEAVFDWVAEPTTAHLVIEALAGSGKSTTMTEAATYTPPGDSVIFTAFNREIARALAPKVPEGCEVATLHSHGLRAVSAQLGRREVDKDLTFGLAKRLMGGARETLETRRAVCKLVAGAKATLAWGMPALDAVADRFELDLGDKQQRAKAVGAAQHILEQCRDTPEGSPIDFDDMIWLPVVRGWPVRQADWCFVDETQDLNPAQLELTRKIARHHVVAVGDRRQAIYAFRGADPQAIPRMIRELEATVLPLSICYRCPVAVIQEAQQLVPQIEAAPGAPEGLVRHAPIEALRAQAGPGDFVISRVNAPLVSLAFRFLGEGRRAVIRGRDIGAGLTQWVRAQNAGSVRELLTAVADWEAREADRIVALERDPAHVYDRAECLRAICRGATSPDEVAGKIDRLFSDDMPGGAIILTSTHRAKGLEADRVWVLRDTYCKRPGVEERNLLYVAITRAQRELVYVSGEDEGEP